MLQIIAAGVAGGLMKTSPFACRLIVYVCVAVAFFLILTQPVLSLAFALPDPVLVLSR
jgi:hypothetical protein